MLSLGAIGFALPWMLSALAALPILWWLLRVTPPAPRRITFPPVRILMSLTRQEETPAHTPWWLLLLRLVIAALIIIALARPVLNPGADLAGTGPILIVVDDGWAAAQNWQRRLDAMEALIDQADREDRPVLLAPTAPRPGRDAFPVPRPMTAGAARGVIRAMTPQPWPSDRDEAAAALAAVTIDDAAEVFWLTDGLAGGEEALARVLGTLGEVTVIVDAADENPVALLQPEAMGATFTVRAVRPTAAGRRGFAVHAMDERGNIVANEEVQFADDATAAETAIELPAELRNRMTRLELDGVESAGAVVLLDERWRRRPVGVVAGGPIETNQPLLSETYYLRRAMAPFAEVREGTIAQLMERELAVMVLSDIGLVVGTEHDRLIEWVDAGGVLVRFAGPRMAESADDLVPVRLRRGGRELGGALSWSEPASLAPFEETSPFFALPIPDDVFVHRQVLAEPALDLGDKTWARLADGTPLVTASPRGDGWLVLFHTTANMQWSNLAISGLFVAMLQRITNMAQGVGVLGGEQMLPPLATLDGFGRLGEPGATALPVQEASLQTLAVGPAHPPGYYGRTEGKRALNLTAPMTALAPLADLPESFQLTEFADGRERELQAYLIAFALALVLLDMVIGLMMRGLITTRRAKTAAIGLALVAFAFDPPPAAAQANGDDSFALAASLETRLAYVLTGNDDVDAMSRNGLFGLTDMLRLRTSVEGAEPMGVNIERDEILFFPLLYWPIVPEQPALSDRALAKIDHYMKTGGTILFDTRDQDGADAVGASPLSPGTARLRSLLARLDIPPLVPVPEDHVLTKAFYLMQDFPGRWAGGRVWVERYGTAVNDGVSSLIIGGNDWAAAWATDDFGRPVAAVVPGGEHQREMAFRFGINLVMYALTGNYKADQVHVPAILERLGQ